MQASHHLPDQTKDSFISHPLSQTLEPPLMMDRLEKATNSSFDDVVHTVLLEGPSQYSQALVWTPLETEKP